MSVHAIINQIEYIFRSLGEKYSMNKWRYLILFMMLIASVTACTPSVKISIIFDTNGGSNVESIVTDIQSMITLPDDPEKEGYSFTGWFLDNETFDVPFTSNSLIDKSLETDIVLYAKWEINQYEVRYLDHDGSLLHSQKYYYGSDLSTVKEPNDPCREGYTFIGWDKTVPNIMPATNVTLVAGYSVNQYAISFYMDDGITEIDTLSVNFGTDLSTLKTPTIPEKEGYTAVDWGLKGKMGATDIRFTATYIINQYKVTYIDYDGSILQTTYYDFNSSLTGISAPTNPSRDGHLFLGWDKVLPDKMPSHDLSISPIYLHGTPIYTYDDLINISNDLSKNYILMSDIDLDGEEWNPLGSYETPFTGNFYGNGYSILNMTITKSINYIGLFANFSGEISNLELKNININIQTSLSGIFNIGGIAGVYSGKDHYFKNIIVSGNINVNSRGSSKSNIGGFVGTQSGGLWGSLSLEVIDSHSYVDIETSISNGQTNVGGFFGLLGQTFLTFIDSSNNGNLFTNGHTGGFVGEGKSASIQVSRSVNNGNITFFKTNNIYDRYSIGGFVGKNDYSASSYTDSYNNGDILNSESYNTNSGGFVGQVFGGTYSFDKISNNGNVNGVFSGGIIGMQDYYSIVNIIKVTNNASIYGICSGGLIGFTDIIKQLNISISQNNSFINGERAGGIIGATSRSSSWGFNIFIDNSKNVGEISGSRHAGGFVGWSYSTIIEIYNSINVNYNANDNFSGFIGFTDFAKIENSISINSVLVGSFTDVESINNYYYGSESNSIGELVNANLVDNLDFYINTMKWSTNIWDFSILNIETLSLPVLIIS